MVDDEAISRLARTLESHEARIRGLEIIEATASAERKNMSSSLNSIQSDIKWLIRLIIGAMILAIVGFVVDGGLADRADAAPVELVP